MLNPDQKTVEHLIIFTRYPIAGTTKTRLIPALGAAGAAELQRQLTEHTMQTVQGLSVDVSVYFSGGNTELMQAWLGKDWQYQQQTGGDLGDRLIHALRDSEAQGYQRTVIIGIDCPELTTEILQAAFVALTNHAVVLGQAHDGGYYLIGLQRTIPELFTEMPWSTATVFSETLERTQNLGLSTKILPTLHDIDHPADLAIWQKLQGFNNV